MKESTKKILAGLVMGTAAIGVKYQLDKVENKKKKKTNKTKKVQDWFWNNGLKEKKERYTKLNYKSNSMPSEKETVGGKGNVKNIISGSGKAKAAPKVSEREMVHMEISESKKPDIKTDILETVSEVTGIPETVAMETATQKISDIETVGMETIVPEISNIGKNDTETVGIETVVPEISDIEKDDTEIVGMETVVPERVDIGKDDTGTVRMETVVPKRSDIGKDDIETSGTESTGFEMFHAETGRSHQEIQEQDYPEKHIAQTDIKENMAEEPALKEPMEQKAEPRTVQAEEAMQEESIQEEFFQNTAEQKGFFSLEEEQGELEMKEEIEIVFANDDMDPVNDTTTVELMNELIGAVRTEKDGHTVTAEKQREESSNLSAHAPEQKNETVQEEMVDLEDAKNILRRKINWQEAEGVQTKTDYSRMPATTILDASKMSSAQIKSLFTIQDISDRIFERIQGKSYKADCILPRKDLRYLRLLYYGFDEKIHLGEMIVNVSIAEDVRDIFYLLYQEQYPIERMVLVDEYDADDILSMSANNTSGFNYRKIDGMSVLSKHSRGLAIDVNPKYNPCVRTINGEISCQPQSGVPFMDREKTFQYKIDHEDLCYCLFRTYGFAWGGDWEELKDYQHFQKQY